jgi:hypothetical protein
MAEPTADRPWLYGRSGLDPVLLPWRWARHRLETARGYWVSSTRLDGGPHARPIWGVWLEESFWFSTGSLAAGHLPEHPTVTLHLGSTSEVVIVEGTAAPIGDAERLRPAVVAYNVKYEWDYDPNEPDTWSPESWFVVRPEVVFGWVVDDSGRDGGAAFHATATRWRFTT